MTATAASAPPAFWNRIAAKYARQPIADEDAYRTTLERTRAWLSPRDRVIEAGAGTGTTALRLAPSVADYLVTDYSAEMIAIARAKIRDAGATNVRTAVAPAEALPEGPADVVLAFNLLHLAPDVPATLAALRRHVKPGGLLISKSACLAGKPHFRLLVGAMRLVGKAPPVTFLSVEGLEAAIRHAGFEIEETGSYPARPPSRFVVARRPPEA